MTSQSAQLQKWVDELLSVGLIAEFQVPSDSTETFAGQRFWWVTGWHHQKIDRPSVFYPDPYKFVECSPNARRPLALEGIGRDRKGEEEKGETPLPPVVSIPASLDSPDFREAWADYQAHRREIRKPLKPTGLKSCLKTPGGDGNRPVCRALRLSIANGWQGVFEPKDTEQAHARAGEAVSDEDKAADAFKRQWANAKG